MVFIPPPHMLKRPDGPQDPRKARHETTVGMFVVFVICLGITLFVFIVGPRDDNPPPPAVGYAVSALTLLFGLVAFFSWLHEQSEPDSPESGDTPDRES
jgi:hypothetical protein